jgi:CelD/BcsL family acetyltransferase involved in cellulose biosynthesis
MPQPLIMPISANTLSSVEDIPQWLLAAADAEIASPFCSLAWYAVLATTALPSEHSPRFVVSSSLDGGDISAAIFPYVSERKPGAARTLKGLTSFYHPKFDPVLLGPRADEHRDCVLRAFAESARAADIVDFSPLEDSDSGIREALAQALAREGYIVDSYAYGNNWTLKLVDETFRDYFSSLPSRMVNTISRKTKRLQKIAGFSIRIFDAPDSDLEQAIDDFVAVYASSWKNPEPFPDFIPALCRLAARHGWLRLGVLRVADAPAAAQLWLVCKEKAYIFKLAYDEKYSEHSVGSVLTAEMMRRVIDDDQCREVDFCTGDDAYKKDWMNHRSNLVGLIAFNRRSVRGLAAASRHFGGRLAKRWGLYR